jgi:hypothetical protein
MFPQGIQVCPQCIKQSAVSILVVHDTLADCQRCRTKFTHHRCSNTWLSPGDSWLAFVDNQFTASCAACGGLMMLTSPTTYQPGSDADRVIGGFLIVAAVVGLISYFSQPPPRPRQRRRKPNRERLEAWKRPYVYERDGRRCTYCGVFVPWGGEHIDHSISRRNGGTNHLNNLRLSCPPCNLSKGSLNARQFRY